jgi:hypothetical protein
MKRLTSAFVVIFLAALTFWPQSIALAAQGTVKVTGGGTGTFGKDLDGDGDIDGSQFGVGVILQADGSAQGHFECLMAGRSQIATFHLMSVGGPVTRGAVNSDGSVTLSGNATVHLNPDMVLRDVPFRVKLTAGGPGVGHIQLTVIGHFDGGPGDTILGNGNYDLPPDTVRSGQIVIH